MSDGPIWHLNPGHCPPALVGTRKRVAVRLRNGIVDGEQPLTAATPAGWPAWTDRTNKERTRWTLERSPFDIIEYRVLGE